MRREVCLGESPQNVAGADGSRHGWVVVIAALAPQGGLSPRDVLLARDFPALLELTRDCASLAVDIPIGLSRDGRREADFAARRFVGPRRSSVFPPPARALLRASGDYRELNDLSKRLTGRGISQQTYNILPKIREADAAMTPDLQTRVVESHPEVVFCILNGSPLDHAKRPRTGRAKRRELLQGVYGAGVALQPPPGVAWDDLYDAAVLVRTAARVARGESCRLPAEPPLDERGLRMEIVY